MAQSVRLRKESLKGGWAVLGDPRVRVCLGLATEEVVSTLGPDGSRRGEPSDAGAQCGWSWGLREAAASGTAAGQGGRRRKNACLLAQTMGQNGAGNGREWIGERRVENGGKSAQVWCRGKRRVDGGRGRDPEPRGQQSKGRVSLLY